VRPQLRSFALALALLVASASATARAAQVVDRVVAVVSGTVILLSDARAVVIVVRKRTGRGAGRRGLVFR